MKPFLPFLCLFLAGCAAPKVKHTPPLPPKRAMSSAPRLLRAQAPASLWLVWGPKSWVEVEWDRNRETNISYIVHRGPASRTYDAQFSARNNINAWVPVMPGSRYYLAVTAYDTNGLESELSNEVSYDAPVNPVFTALVTRTPPTTTPVGAYKIESRDSLGGSWVQFATVTNAFLPITATETRFFRVLKQ